MRSIRLASLFTPLVALFSLVPTAARAAGPSFEYKIEKSGRVNLVGLSLGTRELGLAEVERQMAEEAKDGWRLASVVLVPEDKFGGYSFVQVYERQIGGTPVDARVAEIPTVPTPVFTPRPERTPRPPPTDLPCLAEYPCVVETFLGAELTIDIGKKYNVRLKSGDIVNGKVTAARRSEVVLEMTSGSRTLSSAEISDMTLR